MTDPGASPLGASVVLRALAYLHGHAGWLAALALAHPAVMLRRPRRRVLAVAIVATLLVSAVAALGAFLYPPYREVVKPALSATAPVAAALFERKEHLGVLAVVLAWAGLVLVALGQGRVQSRVQSHIEDGGFDERREIGRAAFVAYAGAAAAAVGSAAAGLVVAIQRSF